MSFDRKRLTDLFNNSVFLSFACLLFCGLLLLCILLLFFKKQLYESDHNLVLQEVERYIHKNGLDSIKQRRRQFAVKGLDDLGNLDFVKFARYGEQILLVSSRHKQFTPNELLHFPVAVNKGWIFLEAAREPFVVVNYKAADFVLQAGARAAHFETYQSLKRFSYLGFMLYMVVAGGLSLLLHQLVQLPMRKTSEKIAELAKNPNAASLLECGSNKELDSLHKQINRLVAQNRKLVSEIQNSLDNVAHDLRTPVTRLRSVAEYALQSNDAARLKDALADCLEESEQIAAILKIMMSVAEAESGTMNLDLQAVELGSGLRDVVDLYEYVAEDKAVSVELSVHEQLYVNIDSVRMRQVWANLLDNAIKYGRVGGYVHIKVSCVSDMVQVAFVDDGMGISDAEIHKVWERLYRGDRSRSEKGLGLGLNYVKAVVEAHQGSVSVSSVLNKGTEFIVSLPLSVPALGER